MRLLVLIVNVRSVGLLGVIIVICEPFGLGLMFRWLFIFGHATQWKRDKNEFLE